MSTWSLLFLRRPSRPAPRQQWPGKGCQCRRLHQVRPVLGAGLPRAVSGGHWPGAGGSEAKVPTLAARAWFVLLPAWILGPGSRVPGGGSALKGRVGSLRRDVGPASSSEGHTGQEAQPRTLAHPDRPAGGAGPPPHRRGPGGEGLRVSGAHRAPGSRASDRRMARPPQVDFLK